MNLEKEFAWIRMDLLPQVHLQAGSPEQYQRQERPTLPAYGENWIFLNQFAHLTDANIT
ncbi:hypothetical protein X474_19760 [Dethiosulfatarculus sandiegensis]|uniref:Uncharacterized protein n=1 Tax=Dethiosulfatarculus sandiegensis TaxID=1429043 RepID=A0A0D2J961_9BACT|nr:hypothetical protein X474_19760 [Dethiosulfatarculus sandiegensis]